MFIILFDIFKISTKTSLIPLNHSRLPQFPKCPPSKLIFSEFSNFHPATILEFLYFNVTLSLAYQKNS